MLDSFCSVRAKNAKNGERPKDSDVPRPMHRSVKIFGKIGKESNFGVYSHVRLIAGRLYFPFGRHSLCLECDVRGNDTSFRRLLP